MRGWLNAELAGRARERLGEGGRGRVKLGGVTAGKGGVREVLVELDIWS